VLDLLVLEHFLHVQDRSRRHAGAIEGLDPLGARLLREDPVELGVHLLAVLRAVARFLNRGSSISSAAPIAVQSLRYIVWRTRRC